jgi:hypothetical protein
MSYTVFDFPTKKALREALASGATVRCYNPGPFPLQPGVITLEGPHYPKPHRWYAEARIDESLAIIPGSLS